VYRSVSLVRLFPARHRSATYLLLLHELGVRAVVDDILAEHGGREDGVDFFGANVADLAVQDEVVALCAEVDRRLLAEQDERETIAILSP